MAKEICRSSPFPHQRLELKVRGKGPKVNLVGNMLDTWDGRFWKLLTWFQSWVTATGVLEDKTNFRTCTAFIHHICSTHQRSLMNITSLTTFSVPAYLTTRHPSRATNPPVCTLVHPTSILSPHLQTAAVGSILGLSSLARKKAPQPLCSHLEAIPRNL